MLVKCSCILWYMKLVSGDIVCHSKQNTMLMIETMMTTVMVMMCKCSGIYGGRKGEYCLWRYQCRYRQQLLGSAGQISLLCSYGFVMEHMKIQVKISWVGQSTRSPSLRKDSVTVFLFFPIRVCSLETWGHSAISPKLNNLWIIFVLEKKHRYLLCLMIWLDVVTLGEWEGHERQPSKKE